MNTENSIRKKKKLYLSERAGLFAGVSLVLSVSLLLYATVLAMQTPDFHGLLFFWYGGFGIYVYCIWRFLYRPARETFKIYRLFAEGYLLTGMFELRYPISPEEEMAMEKLKEMINSHDMINLSKKQAEYLALQNQINPHFLYNTLEGIRSEAISRKVPGVAKMSEALATFFRYTMSTSEHLVTLEDELVNIENYCIIQQYRFGERLKLSVEYDEEDADILRCRMPKLTLQPIVENSIYHGIERKVGRGTLRIKITCTAKRLIIMVSDDGVGMSKSQVESLNEKLRTTSIEEMHVNPTKKGGIAVINVNNRIKLLYGDAYGIYIYSEPDVGTDVEITIPFTENGAKA